MEQRMTKNERRYLRHVSCLLPVKGKDEKQFLKNIKQDLHEFTILHPNSSYQALQDEFGTPLDVSCSYLSSQSPTFWVKRTRLKKHFFRIVCIFSLSINFGLCIYTNYLISEYYKTMDQAVAGYTETIEVGDEEITHNEE